jgi:two-component system cell cycle response regulator DivK
MASEPILIVDDNAVNLKLARLVLEDAGYVVTTAASAAEALAVLERAPPRLILMDIQLPDMDGLELTRRLKRDPVHRGIAIVALTAYAMKGDRAKALAAGCDGYVTKPIDFDGLIETVAAHLRPA